ncbi:DUF6328 family protein [Nocardioides pacificus]
MNAREHADDRDETPTERLDRNWNELLQEMRVMQTGVQLIAGFLLTLPFQERFEDLNDFQRVLYLCLVVQAGLTTILLITPIAVHRMVFGQHVKERLVRTAHRLVTIALGAIALLLTGIVTLVFDMVIDRTASMAVGGTMLLACVLLLGVVPYVVAHAKDSTS